VSSVEELAEELAEAQQQLLAAADAVPDVAYAKAREDGWCAAEVVGHAVEFQPFWAREIQRMIEQVKPRVGRLDDVARQERLIAVKRGAELKKGPALLELRRSAHEALQQVRALSPDQLSRKGLLIDANGDANETSIEKLVNAVLVKHLEEHAQQLRSLFPSQAPGEA